MQVYDQGAMTLSFQVSALHIDAKQKASALGWDRSHGMTIALNVTTATSGNWLCGYTPVPYVEGPMTVIVDGH